MNTAPLECPNCGAARSGEYCTACGQRDTPLRQSLGAFWSESFAEYMGVDGRIWRSLAPLMFRPGWLTQEYLVGRRTHYLRPLRIYLVATLLFFFLLSILDPVEKLGSVGGSTATNTDTLVTVRDRLARVDAAIAEELEEQREEQREARLEEQRDDEGSETVLKADADSLDFDDSAIRRLRWQRTYLASLPPDSLVHVGNLEVAARALYPPDEPNLTFDLPDWLPESVAAQRLESAQTFDEARNAFTDLGRNAIERVPTVMFLMLPVFALLLKLLYVRRGWYYTEHLVFALHTHAFAFLVFSLIAVLFGFVGVAVWVWILSLLLFLIIPAYFVVAQKRVYGQDWPKTIIKVIMLAFLYWNVILGLGLTLAMTLAAISS